MNLSQANILVVDDDADVLTAARLLLKPEAKSVATESNPERILRLLSENSFDVLLLDMNFNSALNTGNEGLYWLRRVKDRNPDLAVIMITGVLPAARISRQTAQPSIPGSIRSSRTMLGKTSLIAPKNSAGESNSRVSKPLRRRA